jgi:hypothetical protein
LTNFQNNPYDLECFTFHRKFIPASHLTKASVFLKTPHKYTVCHTHSNLGPFLEKDILNFYKNFFITRTKVKHRVKFSNHPGKQILDYGAGTVLTFDYKFIGRVLTRFANKKSTKSFKNSHL